MMFMLAVACGGGSEVNCPNTALICPSPQPTWSATVQPLMQAKCVRCHTPGGQNGQLLFDTYQQVFNARASILTQVYACKMPPAGEPQLTDAERTTLIGWLECGAKNN